MTKERASPRLASDIDHLREPHLGDDRAELPARCRDTMRRRAVPRRERLAGDDERYRVRAEVLEEVREAVQEHERPLASDPGMVHHRIVRRA